MVSAVVLFVLGLAHSILGERELIGPLVQDSRWSIGLPRPAADRLLRFAWHLTSVAWFAMGAILLGCSVEMAVGIGLLTSALLTFGFLAGHFAWPLFLLGGIACFHGPDGLPSPLVWSVTGASVVVALGAALLHVYWAAGGRWGSAVAIPSAADGTPAFQPGPWACLAVSAALLLLAGLEVGVAMDRAPGLARWALVAAAVVLGARAVGDGRQVGFSKTDRSTAFARADDALFTPLVVVLGAGVGVALFST